MRWRRSYEVSSGRFGDIRIGGRTPEKPLAGVRQVVSAYQLLRSQMGIGKDTTGSSSAGPKKCSTGPENFLTNPGSRSGAVAHRDPNYFESRSAIMANFMYLCLNYRGFN